MRDDERKAAATSWIADARAAWPEAALDESWKTKITSLRGTLR